ncbi:3-oxoacyl-[acyl-carrier protein] reductase [Fulvivirga imtechensis AK7]|uniref:3-oxoacyl-[acyl-carrier protein] reductase n=1 Tax=Fulvivirga imtechensis AK7 TaxID=1237149 RepID=L8JWX0_9BACT|nr:SDR family NAD(P)-dependent oxidoreductase [Fulvivirga imtechensis]ELR72693.1 3-oxoacyl-[acyl-carrier protein] reductase [Fulvivirga imtechensis AK7]
MSNRVAIITAAGKGMGAACARELSQQGYQVALMSRSESSLELAQELGGLGVQGSVTEKDDLKKLVNATLGKFGRIDAVVNNTGHPAKGKLLELGEEDWHQGLNLVVLNVAKMAQLVTPVMQKQGGGAFVNISTFAAYEPSPSFPISSVLRAALGSYAKLYADQYAKDNIRMNNLLPGFIDSYPDQRRSVIPYP